VRAEIVRHLPMIAPVMHMFWLHARETRIDGVEA
jgi:hypothetical protein